MMGKAGRRAGLSRQFRPKAAPKFLMNESRPASLSAWRESWSNRIHDIVGNGQNAPNIIMMSAQQ
jgi:hypothetical protein